MLNRRLRRGAANQRMDPPGNATLRGAGGGQQLLRGGREGRGWTPGGGLAPAPMMDFWSVGAYQERHTP
jgi:hypothetical protein